MSTKEELQIFKPLGAEAYSIPTSIVDDYVVVGAHKDDSSLDREFLETLIHQTAAREKVLKIAAKPTKRTVVVPVREKQSHLFTPESGYYSTGNGDQVYAFRGTEPDISACDSECGYCGRC